MGLRDIDGVGVAVPNKLDGRKRVVPSEVHAADARPVGWKIPVIDGKRFLVDREYSARAQNRNPLSAGFQFVWRITRNNRFLFFIAVVLDIINRHRDNMPIWRAFLQEAAHDFGHAEQRRECHPNRTSADIRSGESFRVNVRRRLVSPWNFSRHIETLRCVLLCQGDAGAFQCFTAGNASSGGRSRARGVHDRCCFFESVHARTNI
jgi:hypothetical protein